MAPRQPEPTPELVISFTLLEIFRDANGHRWCNDTLVGMLRRKLGHPAEDSAPQSIKVTRKLLAEFCKACPHACIMREW